jgi:hypothetical protein
LHLPDHYRSVIDPDTQLWTEPVRSLYVDSGRGKTLLDKKRCATRSKRAILQRRRHSEQRHYAIAREVLHRATLLMDGIAQQLCNLLHELIGGFLARPFRKGRESNEIGKKNSYLAALTSNVSILIW